MAFDRTLKFIMFQELICRFDMSHQEIKYVNKEQVVMPVSKARLRHQ